MKIRNGFVSNSSSSSFLIYGTRIEPDDIPDVIKSRDTDDELDSDDEYECDYDDYQEHLDKLFNKTGIDAIQYGDYYYIGKSWHLVKDDETGLQFKQSVEKIIKEKFPTLKRLTFKTYDEAWSSY